MFCIFVLIIAGVKKVRVKDGKYMQESPQKNLHAMKIIPSKRRSIKSDIASKHPEISHTQNDPIIETRYIFQGPSFLGIHMNFASVS